MTVSGINDRITIYNIYTCYYQQLYIAQVKPKSEIPLSRCKPLRSTEPYNLQHTRTNRTSRRIQSRTSLHDAAKKFSTKISLEDLLGKFAVKWILKIPPHLANVATLPKACKTLMSAKQALNDKLQGSAAAHFKVWWGC